MKKIIDGNQITFLDERFYQSPKDKNIYYPSVTTVLDAYPKGKGLTNWLKQVGYNADIIIEKAGQVGSNVHDAIDKYLNKEELNWMIGDETFYSLEEWKMICKFVEFWKEYKPELIAHEYNVVSDKYKLGGTIDLVCKINGETWLIDYKTSNAIYPSHHLQIGAYSTMWNEICKPDSPNVIQRYGIFWLKSKTRGPDKDGKKIQGSGWILKEPDMSYEKAFEYYENVRVLWNLEHPNPKPKFLTLPNKLKNMSKEIDNPPAFPIRDDLGVANEGMTLRDYFAAKALQAYGGGEYTGQSGMPHEKIAEWSYGMADAMLKERTK